MGTPFAEDDEAAEQERTYQQELEAERNDTESYPPENMPDGDDDN